MKDWQRVWVLEFLDSEAFTIGYLWVISVVGIWPLFLACGWTYFERGTLGLCSVLTVVGIAGLLYSVSRLRDVGRSARESYRMAQRRHHAATARD